MYPYLPLIHTLNPPQKQKPTTLNKTNRLPKTTTALKDDQGNAITYSVPVPQRHYDEQRCVGGDLCMS